MAAKKRKRAAGKRANYMPPARGAFTAYKKGLALGSAAGFGRLVVVIELRVPARAKRVYCRRSYVKNNQRKFRVSEALVVSIKTIPDYPGQKAQSLKAATNYFLNHGKLVYRVGKTARPAKKFNGDDQQMCGSGIHAFVSRRRATAYLG